MEKHCTDAMVRAVSERAAIDYGTVLNVLSALDAERANAIYSLQYIPIYSHTINK